MRTALITIHVALLACCLFSQAKDAPITIANDQLQAEFGPSGLRHIRDLANERKIAFAADRFSIAVGDQTFNSEKPADSRSTKDKSVTYTWQLDGVAVRVVYELSDGWRFVSKRIFGDAPAGSEFTVGRVMPFDGQVQNPLHQAFRLNGDRYGVSLRMKAKEEDASPTHGCFLLVQNPHSKIKTEGQGVSLSYAADMKWKAEHGAFASDRMCIPFSDLHHQRYTVYWETMAPGFYPLRLDYFEAVGGEGDRDQRLFDSRRQVEPYSKIDALSTQIGKNEY